MPVQPNGGAASCTNLDTWSNYTTVAEMYSSGQFDGVGIVLTQELGITGVDYDKCSEGENPHPDLAPFFNALNTYTERSPSGNGYRSFLFGRKMTESCRVKYPTPNIKEIEIYEHGRFLTVTGQRLETYPAEIQQCQDGLEEVCSELWPKEESNGPVEAVTGKSSLSDTEVLQRIRSSKQSSKFESLFTGGDLSAYNGDASAADMALCCILVFWTNGSLDQMDRIFRGSALMRGKWDEMRGQQTYGELTITNALVHSTERYSDDGERSVYENFQQRIDNTEDEFELLSTLASDISNSTLSTALSQKLRRMISKKTGVTQGALEKDSNRRATGGQNQHLAMARQAINNFGDGNLVHTRVGFYEWQDTGVWAQADEQDVRKQIHAVSGDEITGGTVDSILKLVRTECHDRNVRFGEPFEGVNCLNGELFFTDSGWELHPHRKVRGLISQIPVIYDPQADAPRFRKFLEEVFEGDSDGEDKAQLILELFGYSLLSTCRYEKFVILVGSGANGKSVLLDLLKALCGISNVSAVAPEKLDNNFQRAHLQGKYANLITEIAEGAVLPDAAMKAITSGEHMTAERKFGHPFDFSPYATLWFGTNHMPHTRDFSAALFRRACVLRFNRKFTGANCDHHLKEKLVNELPGVLNMALEAIANVLETGAFTEPDSMLAARQEWRVEADQVEQFIVDCCRFGEFEIPKSQLYGRYKLWAEDMGIRKRLTQRSFTSRLLNRAGVGERRTSIERLYTGIDITQAPTYIR